MKHLFALLWAGCGGFLGAALRYGAGTLASARLGALGFLWGTFIVNILGSFAIGFLAPFWAEGHPRRVFVITGLLGGFTTFSSFSSDTLRLLQTGRPLAAFGYCLGSVAFGLAAAWAGYVLHEGLFK